MPNILDEYLIKLGAVVDRSSMAAFDNAIRDTAAMVSKLTFGISSTLATVGGALLGTVDKVAMADQSYRLFALHMYMGQKAGRELKITLDALGESLGDITWDPELRSRAAQLIKDQEAMAAGLGGAFESNMKRVRDFRFEFQRLYVVGQYGLMELANDLVERFAPSLFKAQGGLEGVVNYLIHNLPSIASQVTDKLVYAFEEIKKAALEVWAVIKEIDVAFVNLVGAVTGHPELVSDKFSAKNTALAIKYGSVGLAHVLGNTAASIGGFMAPSAPSGSQIQVGRAQASAGTNEITKALLFAAMGNDSAAWTAIKSGMSLTGRSIANQTEGWLANSPAARNVINALAMQESSWTQYSPSGGVLTSRAGAKGVMQLMPGTAKSLGVDINDPMQNFVGGAAYYHSLLTRYHGNTAEALGAYNAGPGRMDAVLAGRATLPSETKAYIARVMRASGSTGSVQIGNISIAITQPNASPSEIQHAVTRGVAAAQNKQVQRNLYEFRDLQTSY